MQVFTPKLIPPKAGIGLRYLHYQEIARNTPDIAWLEGHSENFFMQGGIVPHILEVIRHHYPMSFHGVGLSLGSASGIDEAHLKRLKEIVDCYNPALVSEHISWSRTDNGVVVNDLLPLPYTDEAVKVVCDNIDHVQQVLSRQILVENPSTYLEFESSHMPEYEFMAKVADQSGCGLLLDVNNIYVGHKNHGIDLRHYINAIDADKVQEIHLAGHLVRTIENQTICIDHHGDVVCDAVWDLYRQCIQKLGAKPTLIEWDTDIPALDVLMAEAAKAQAILDAKVAHAS